MPALSTCLVCARPDLGHEASVEGGGGDGPRPQGFSLAPNGIESALYAS